MTAVPTIWWMHDQCGCARAPLVGARYRRMSINILTGEPRGYRYYTVAHVDPIRHDRLFCRRALLIGDTGDQCELHVQDLFLMFEAVGNITSLASAIRARADRQTEKEG